VLERWERLQSGFAGWWLTVGIYMGLVLELGRIVQRQDLFYPVLAVISPSWVAWGLSAVRKAVCVCVSGMQRLRLQGMLALLVRGC
jgi:hypothetical protein